MSHHDDLARIDHRIAWAKELIRLNEYFDQEHPNTPSIQLMLSSARADLKYWEGLRQEVERHAG